MAAPIAQTCRRCRSDPRFTHTEREHDVADAWIPALLDHIKMDVFADTDRPLTYKDCIAKFDLDVHVRRVGRVLDAVELILRSRGWPGPACGGVAAYVVNASTGEPGDGWKEIWKVSPRDARAEARVYVRELALAD